MYGAGATRDAGFVSITPPASLMIDMLLIRGVLGIGLPKLSAVQGALLQRAKKYAMEVCMRQLGDYTLTQLIIILLPQVSIKLVLMKQTMAHQQQQTKYLQRQQAVSIMSR